MSWIDAARARLTLVFRRKGAESRMNEEFRFHIEMETDRLVRDEALPRDEARRRTLAAFGGVEKHKEELRATRGLAWLGGFSLDLKLAFRMLAKYPGLTVVGTFALAVAIAVGAAYIEVIGDLYHPSLKGDPDQRVMRMHKWDPGTRLGVSYSLREFEILRGPLEQDADIGATRPFVRNLITADGVSEPGEGVEVTAAGFRVLPQRPLLGRHLIEADEAPDAPSVAVISEAIWRRRFGADSGVLGQEVRVGSASYTIVGVMPESFRFPINYLIWLPLRPTPRERAGELSGRVGVFGRLKPGVTAEQLQARLRSIALPDNPERARTQPALSARVLPFLDSIMADGSDGLMEKMLYALNLIGVVFLAACAANVATLVFARTATREGELSVRTALGASRARIVGQLFAEALALCALAAVVGLVVARVSLGWGRDVLERAAGGRVPFWWNDNLSISTVIYVALLTLFAAVIVGVVPALKATGRSLQEGLKRGAGGSVKFGRMWTGVIVSQVAFTALFLFVVASVAWNVRSGRYFGSTMVAPPSEYATAVLRVEEGPSAEMRNRLQSGHDKFVAALTSDPMVAGVTYGATLPGAGGPWLGLEVEGVPPSDENNGAHFTRSSFVAPNYFETFGARILKGRSFAVSEAEPGHSVAVVDETFVRTVLGGREPIGLRMREMGRDDAAPGDWMEIIGVVNDLSAAPETIQRAMVYRPILAANLVPEFDLVVAIQTRGDARAFAPSLRAIAARVDPDLQLREVMSMSDFGNDGRMAFQILVRVLIAVGVTALVLATAGIYSLMAFTVARRRREIGIRAALGANPAGIVYGTLWRAMRQIAIGILAGSIPGFLLVAKGPPEVAAGAGYATAFAIFAAVGAFMLIVGAVASAVPVRRALRVAPTEALRAGG